MSKTTKKLKTSVKKAKPKPTLERKIAPPISEGLVSIAMLPSDLATLTNLMTICAQSFEEQALAAAQENNEQKYAILAARQKLSSMFASKFVEFCKMPEPQSRDLH